MIPDPVDVRPVTSAAAVPLAESVVTVRTAAPSRGVQGATSEPFSKPPLPTSLGSDRLTRVDGVGAPSDSG